MKSVVEIGSRIEMFIDDWMIEEKKGLELKLHQPIKKEVVLTLDRPWEGPTSGYYSIIQDNGRIRLYYRGNSPGEDSNEDQVTCYAESTNGIDFIRPDLGIHDYKGSKKNNIIFKGIVSHNFSAFLDRSPYVQEDQRYKAVGGVGKSSQHTHSNRGDLFALYSKDGINWNLVQENPVMSDGSFDSHNVAFWDSNSHSYRCYSRYITGTPDMKFTERFRAIQSSKSQDFTNWDKQCRNRYSAGAPIEHFYTNATILCPGAEHIYLSFPKRYVPDRKKIVEHPYPGVSDTVFLTSRDGEHWDRTFMEAWFRQGLDEKNWTERNGMVAYGCVELENEFSFYVSEHFRRADNRLRRISVRKHGFGSVHAGYHGGEFVTRPLIITGSQLLLNYSTSAVGSIRVEVQDESGQPLEGFQIEQANPLYGDEMDGRITWNSSASLDSLNGIPIRFRFIMQDADLYSLRTK